MLRKLWIVLLVIALSGCASVNQPDEPVDSDNVPETDDSVQIAEYRKVSPEEAKEMMTEDNIILDVRTKEEYETGHIPGAILLPVDSVLDGDLDSLPDKNQIILVYCRSGNRSAVAAKALVDDGYTAVYDFGGIKDWPYEVVQ